MGISITGGGVSGITVETDPTALKLTGGSITGDLSVSNKVGIGGVIPVGATNKLAVHNGNSVFTSGYGIAFGDGTTQITAGLPLTGGTLSGNLTANSNTISARRFVGVPNAGVSGVNIGVGGTDTASNQAGDIWIASGGVNLNFRDGSGAWRICATLSNGNVFSAVQTVSVNSTSPALRVTQTGTGHSLLVEDSTNPDTTPFVITNTGATVIGGLSPASGAMLTVQGNISALGVNCSDITFAGFNQAFKIENDPQPTVMSGPLGSGDYPYEFVVRIGSTTYAMPARIV
jgi:hypothetical protein